MGAVLLPLQRVSRSHHLADAEGIQLKKNTKYEEGDQHSLFARGSDLGGGAALTNPMNIRKLDLSR